MPAVEEPTGPTPELLGWVESTVGQRVVAAHRLPGGNRRQAWVLDTDSRPPRRLFLRWGADADPDADPYSLRREALVYTALRGTPVRLPALLAAHPDGNALLLQYAVGNAKYRTVTDPVERQSIAVDLAEQLAVLHRLDPRGLDLGALGPVATMQEHIRRELATWEGLYRDSGSVDPLIEYGLAWISRSVPAADIPVVLCHGDAGPGNFLYRQGLVTALLDWELAHLGDPMEDLAWVSMRHVLEPLPDFTRFLACYERAAGRHIDPDRIAYFRVLVQLRVAIIRHRDDGATASNSDVANSLVSRALNRRLLLEALAAASRVDLPAVVLPEAPVPDEDWLFDELLGELRDTVAPSVADERAAAKLKSSARIVKFLRRVMRYRDAYAADELAQLSALLPTPPGDHASAIVALCAAIRAGEVADTDVLRQLNGAVTRETSLMRDALGQLAIRHLPPLALGGHSQPDASPPAATEPVR
jgi:aminoglycoside phosphotransferase (APT) family kinase protein